jgi:molybdopterin/thiamine biosynthesis adenylyltransferase
MTTIEYTRQANILNPETAQNAKVTIFGCGTVGSNVAVEAARLGVGNFVLYDFDDVEAHNIPSQRFTKDDLGSLKVDATAAHVEEVSNDANIVTHNKKVDGPVIVGDGIVVLAVDSMDSRSKIYNVLKNQRGISKILDFRMSGNLLQCYSFNPGDDNYEHTLFDDKDAEPAPCGGRTVSYTGALSGCIGANYIRKVLNDADVPFTTVIDLEAMDMIAMG